MKQAYPFDVPIHVGNTVVTFTRTVENPFDEGEREITTCRIAVDNPKYPRAIATGTAYKHPKDHSIDAAGQRLALQRAIGRIVSAANSSTVAANIVGFDSNTVVSEKDLYTYFRREIYEQLKLRYGSLPKAARIDDFVKAYDEAFKNHAIVYNLYMSGRASYADFQKAAKDVLDAQRKLDEYTIATNDCVCSHDERYHVTCVKCNAQMRLSASSFDEVPF